MGYNEYMKKGFTLIEILVVIGITTILSGLLISYSSSSREQITVQIERAKLAQTILRAKSMAVSTFNQSGAQGGVPCGYGVHFDYNPNSPTYDTYNIFKYFVTPCSDITNGISVNDSRAYVPLDTYSLPQPMVKFGDTSQSPDFIFFMPPDPATTLWQNSAQMPPGVDGIINLVTNSQKSRITVNNSGQISF